MTAVCSKELFLTVRGSVIIIGTYFRSAAVMDVAETGKKWQKLNLSEAIKKTVRVPKVVRTGPGSGSREDDQPLSPHQDGPEAQESKVSYLRQSDTLHHSLGTMSTT